jgi:hypothetical protein
MATPVALGYPDQGTAEQAVQQTIGGLEEKFVLEADQLASIWMGVVVLGLNAIAQLLSHHPDRRRVRRPAYELWNRGDDG